MNNNTNLIKAVLKVMEVVKGIDKNSDIGSGRNSYKGVADKDVKEAIGKAMKDNGLIILPTSIEPTVEVSRWEQEETWNNKTEVKQKQSIFTQVKTKYLLIHESGESIELEGYGHGIDAGDKGAGKATTYALKYTLLYAFMVPTGKIDDADNVHSDEQTKPPASSNKKASLAQRKLISKLIVQKGRNEVKLLEHYGIKSLADITGADADNAIKMLVDMPDADLH